MSSLQTDVMLPPLEKWEEFFLQFRKIEDTKPDPLELWQNFFDEFRKFPLPKEEPVQVIMLDEKRVEDFFANFKTYHDSFYESFIENGGTINVWEIAKLKHDEVRNCAVLAWLLQSHGSHGQGDFFFRAFLNSLEISPINASLLSKGYKVTVEQSHENDEIPSNESSEIVKLDKVKTKNRVDFVIENSEFIFFIEAKIHAGEGDRQLKRYSDLLESIKGTRKNALIFLTQKGYIPSGTSELAIKPIPITWRKIALSFEKAMKAHIETKLGKDIYGTLNQPLWAALAQQFCYHIRQF